MAKMLNKNVFRYWTTTVWLKILGDVITPRLICLKLLAVGDFFSMYNFISSHMFKLIFHFCIVYLFI